MLYTVAGVAAILAVVFAVKYFKLKQSIRLVSESLSTRTSILNHSKDFRGSDRSWQVLIDELNSLISDHNRLDRQSSGQLNQIETTLGNLQEGVVIIDRDNYILLVNRALQKLFPQVVDKVGQRIEGIVRSPDFLQFIWDFKKGQGVSKREVAFETDAQEIWLEITGAKLLEPMEGRGPWFLFVFHDITLLKRLENARKAFVANASHELKTPVAVIKGYAETLVSDHESMEFSDRDRFLRTIHRHSERLSLLINDLLNLSRLESETQNFDWVEKNFGAWMKGLVEDYRMGAPREKLLSIDLDLSQMEGVKVRFDVLRLRQVFDNLMENAIKYARAEAMVWVKAERSEHWLDVSVEDDGCGVPDTDLSRIFERFYRVDKGRSRETGGTGLGLSIVKHIVEGHGGRVWAEHGESGGLRVVVRLPVLREREVVAL